MEKPHSSNHSSEIMEMVDLTTSAPSNPIIHIPSSNTTSGVLTTTAIGSAQQISHPRNSSMEMYGEHRHVSSSSYGLHQVNGSPLPTSRSACVAFNQTSISHQSLKSKEGEHEIRSKSTNMLHKKDSTKQIPPSYSTVLKLGPPLFGSSTYPSMPFIERMPPPSYGQVHGWNETPSLTSAESIYLGPSPMYLMCPRCHALVISEIQAERSYISYASSVVLCICLCWPCCLIPLCLRGCQNTYHFCPNCHYYLGVYKPC